jgi:hypothetical protein
MPQSRDDATRISNCDLAAAMLEAPAAAARFWQGHAADLLDSFRAGNKWSL